MAGTAPAPADRTAKVLLHATISLDGFLAGPGDSQGWVFELADASPAVEDVMASSGAMLSGRRSYDVGQRDHREAFHGAWHGAQLVLTHHPPPVSDESVVTFLSTDAADAVERARTAAGGKDVVVTGGDVARQCLEAGVVDEILVHVAPVLIGDGTRLFGRRPTGRIDLELLSATRRERTTELHYRVHRRTPEGTRDG